MTILDPRLLTPPREEETIFPYRRVWRSIAIENGVLLGVALFLTFLGGILVPTFLQRPLSLALALLPLGLWLIFSWLPEKTAVQPRHHILRTVIITMLAANAIGVPLLRDFFVIERWLPSSDTVSRIMGYTFTVGIVQELLKYLVLRFLVWPHSYRTRMDAVAYGVAGAVGYGTVLALHFVVENNPAPDVAAIRVFSIMAQQTICSAIMAFGLAQARFSNAMPILMAFTFAIATLITGFFVPLRAGFSNASFVPGVAGTTPIRALLFAVVVLIGLLLAVAFLLDNAERRDLEAAAAEK